MNNQFEHIIVGDKWLLSARLGFGRQSFVNEWKKSVRENFDFILEWDFLFPAPLGMFLNVCSKELIKLNDFNMQSSLERPNTNFMMILNPLFSSLRAKKTLFIFHHPESIFVNGKCIDPNWDKFFQQFNQSDFVSVIFVSSKQKLFDLPKLKTLTLQRNWKNDSSDGLKFAMSSLKKTVDFSSMNDVEFFLLLESVFKEYWNLLTEPVKDKLAFYSSAVHVISKRFYEKESDEIRNILLHISQEKIDGIIIEDWISRLIYGSLSSEKRIQVHSEWVKKLMLTPRNSRHPETWILHHHLFYSRQYEDSIEVLNDIVDDQLSMDIDGYLPAVLHDYDEVDLPEHLAVEIEEIKDLL